MTTAIGPAFRCPDIVNRTETAKNRKMRVFECDCGEIYVEAVNDLRKNGLFQACPTCIHEEKTEPWRQRLRERIIRIQNGFRDRTGPRRCARCGKRRETHSPASGIETYGMCRECYSNARVEHQQSPRIDGYSVQFLGNKHWETDPSPSWENIIRMIEDA